MRKIGHWILACVVLLLSHTAWAAPCGEYVSKDGYQRYVFEADGSGRYYIGDGDPSRLRVYEVFMHYRNGEVLTTRNVETGYQKTLPIQQQGRTLASDWDPLTARTPYACAPVEALRAKVTATCEPGQEQKCCAAGDLGACVESMPNDARSVKRLQEMCRQQPDACIKLIGIYVDEANRDQRVLADMYAFKKPLPAARLDELPAMCSKHQTPDLCRKVISQLWLGQRWDEARHVLTQACAADLDDPRCKNQAALQAVQFPAGVVAAKTAPCGHYASSGNSLLSELDIGNHAQVQMGLGLRSTARLENGLIHIRHDKGGDFVFAMPDAGTLVGLDEWMSMAVLKRQAVPAQACTPPIIYREQALSDSCGLDKDPQACCAAGDTQGCNRLGNMAALSGQWREAARHYATVCTAMVRAGCENWVSTISHTGDVAGVKQGLQAICQKDPARTHVACDVLKNGNFASQELAGTIEKLLRDAAASPAKKRR